MGTSGLAANLMAMHGSENRTGEKIEMTKIMKSTLGSQRLFQYMNGTYVLLSRAGAAVSFWMNDQNQVHVVEKLEDVDFKATGTQLKKEGWKCVGPGIEFAWLLEEEKKNS